MKMGEKDGRILASEEAERASWNRDGGDLIKEQYVRVIR